MSEMEFRIGKVKEVAKEQDSFEKKIRLVSETYNIPLNKLVWENDGILDFEDKYVEHNQFVYTNERLYEILEDNNYEEDAYLAEAKEIESDVYEFRLRYYNGAASFGEVLGEAIEKLK